MPLKVHFLNVGRGDCTIIEFPSGRVGMVDVYNLKVLDDDTRQELLEEYRRSPRYRESFYSGYAGASLAAREQEFVKRAEEQLTDPIEYYGYQIGSTRDVFRMIVTHPDMDHMTGLYRLYKQEYAKDIVNF